MSTPRKPAQHKTTSQFLQERIDKGFATCACTRKATKIKDSQPVCDICGGGRKSGMSAGQQNKPVGRRGMTNAYAEVA